MFGPVFAFRVCHHPSLFFHTCILKTQQTYRNQKSLWKTNLSPSNLSEKIKKVHSLDPLKRKSARLLAGIQTSQCLVSYELSKVQTASCSLCRKQDTVKGRQTDRETENADTLETEMSGPMGKKNSRHRSLQNVSSCFWSDPGMEIAALYKAELIWGQLEPKRKHGSWKPPGFVA